MKGQLHRKIVTVKRKGKTFHQARMVKNEAAPTEHGGHWREKAAHVAAIAAPILGGMIGETLGSKQGAHHIANFGNRLAEHGRSMGSATSPGGHITAGGRLASLAARGVGTLLAHQSERIGSMVGGSLGTTVGGAVGHGAVSLLMHKRRS